MWTLSLFIVKFFPGQVELTPLPNEVPNQTGLFLEKLLICKNFILKTSFV